MRPSRILTSKCVRSKLRRWLCNSLHQLHHSRVRIHSRQPPFLRPRLRYRAFQRPERIPSRRNSPRMGLVDSLSSHCNNNPSNRCSLTDLGPLMDFRMQEICLGWVKTRVFVGWPKIDIKNLSTWDQIFLLKNYILF